MIISDIACAVKYDMFYLSDYVKKYTSIIMHNYRSLCMMQALITESIIINTTNECLLSNYLLKKINHDISELHSYCISITLSVSR